MSYHQTTELAPEQLELFTAVALRMRDAVLIMYKRYQYLTPYECEQKLEKATRLRVVQNSVRARISDLKRDGILEKTSTTKAGKYGNPEHVYKLIS